MSIAKAIATGSLSMVAAIFLSYYIASAGVVVPVVVDDLPFWPEWLRSNHLMVPFVYGILAILYDQVWPQKSMLGYGLIVLSFFLAEVMWYGIISPSF